MSILSDRAINLLKEGIGPEIEELSIRQPLIRSIEKVFKTRIPSLNKLTTAELIAMERAVAK